MAVRFFSSLANSSLVSSSCLLNKDVFFIFAVLIVQDQVVFFSCGFSSSGEQWGVEEIPGGENISKIRREGIFCGVCTHRCSKEWEFPWDFNPSIYLWWYSNERQESSWICLLFASGTPSQTLPCHLWSFSLQWRVSFLPFWGPIRALSTNLHSVIKSGM